MSNANDFFFQSNAEEMLSADKKRWYRDVAFNANEKLKQWSDKVFIEAMKRLSPSSIASSLHSNNNIWV
jgi:hypothetical protein